MFVRSNARVLSFSVALVCCALPARSTPQGIERSPGAPGDSVSRPDSLGSGGSRPAVGRPVTPDTEVIAAVDPARRPELLQEFRRHARANRLGYFIDEQQMSAIHVQFASEALRRVPGVTIRPSGGIGNQVRIRGCAPLVWVDGQRTPGAELDEVTHGNDVAALEIYRSLSGVPAEYADRRATCGTILAWLKTN